MDNLFTHSLRVVIIAALATSGVFTSCDKSAPYRKAEGATWGTTYHITYRSAEDLSDSIVSVMRDIDLSLSPFEKSSLVSAVNAGERVKADEMLLDVILLSKQVNEKSEGMFDPTVAPLINLWGFGYAEGAPDTPSQEEIDKALTTVGIADCGIDTEGYVVKKSPETEFNFSAIAKGYGIDCIARMLERNGCEDYMVEVGGEMALRGMSPSGQPWRIQVDAPIVDEEGTVSHSQLKVIQITDACIATSGNYRNHRATSEGEVGHTISPVTGRPVPNTTLSATVVADNTALADALATAVMAMPDTAAMAMIEAMPGVSAMLVKGKVDGGYRLVYTEGFREMIKD